MGQPERRNYLLPKSPRELLAESGPAASFYVMHDADCKRLELWIRHHGSAAVRLLCGQVSLYQVLEPRLLAELPMSKCALVNGQTGGKSARGCGNQFQLIPANLHLLLATYMP